MPLELIRDIWTKNTSSYLNESSSASSFDTSLVSSLNANDSEYIESDIFTNDQFFFRVNSTGIVPSRVVVTARANMDFDGIALALYANGTHLIDVEGWLGSTTSDAVATGTLSDAQRRAIVDNRLYGTYDHYHYNLFPSGGSLPSGSVNGRLINLDIEYITDKDEHYQNFDEPSSPEILKLYPTGISSFRQDIDSTDFLRIDTPPTGVDAHNEFVTVQENGQLDSSLMPSGYVSLHFDVDGYDKRTVNRAILNLGLSLPPSGTGENVPDSLSIEGYNPHVSSGNTNIMWSTGGTVENSGFITYIGELAWLDPAEYSDVPRSGNVASPYHKHIEGFKELELRLRGVPSGTQISSSELQLQMIEANYTPLFTMGNTSKCDVIAPISGGISDPFLTPGNWETSTGSGFFNHGIYNFNQDIGTTDFTAHASSGRFVNSQTGATVTPDIRHQYFNPGVGQDLSTSAVLFRNEAGDRTEHFELHLDNTTFLNNSFTIGFAIEPSGIIDQLSEDDILFYHGTDTDPMYFIRTSNSVPNAIEVTYYDVGGVPRLIRGSDAYNKLWVFVYSNGQAKLISTDQFGTVIDEVVGPTIPFLPFPPNPYFTVGGVPASNTSVTSGGYKGYLSKFMIGTGAMSSGNFKLLADSMTQNSDYLSARESLAQDTDYTLWDLVIASGNAEVGTNYNLADPFDIDPELRFIDGPAKVAYDNIEVAPSGIKLKLRFEHFSDHPSGVYVNSFINFTNGLEAVANYSFEHLIPPSASKQDVILSPRTCINRTIGSGDYTDISFQHTYRYDHDPSGTYYGSLKMFATEALIDGQCVPASDNNNINLVTSGSAFNNDMPLYIHNQFENNNIDLFIKGADTSSGNIDLFIGTVTPSENMNLYIGGLDVPSTGNSIPLTTWSTTNPSTFNTVELFLQGTNVDPDKHLPLFIGESSPSFNESLNLFIGGEPETAGSMDLYMMNETSGSNNSIDMYMNTVTASTSGEVMPLFIQRDSEGISRSMSLFLQAPSGDNNNMNLYLNATFKENNNISLVTDAVGTDNDQDTELYTHGF
jgi:hypothetical protein